MKEQDNRRYPIGPFEYGQTYSFDDTRKHIRALDRFPKDLKKVVKKLRGSDLDKTYRSGGWTVRQVIHHIADSHMNAYIRMKLAVTENTPIIKPYEENLWAQTEDGLHGPIKMSLKLLAALHVRWVDFLGSLSEEDLERDYYNPASKRTVQMQEAIALYVWHSQHHLHHIRLISDGKARSEPASVPDIDIATTADAPSLPAPKRRGPKPKRMAIGDGLPGKRGMSEEHKAKISAAHQARRAGTTGETLPATSKRTRRTQAEMAATQATVAPAGRKKPAPKSKAAVKEAASSSPATARRTRRTKEQMANDQAAAALAGGTAVRRKPGRPAQNQNSALSNAGMPSALRKRRTREEMANDQAAAALASETVVRRKPGRPAQNQDSALGNAGIPSTSRKRSSQSEMTMDRAAAVTAKASGPQRKPGRPAKPKAEKPTGEAPKRRGMSAEHMAKIREARMAKRAEAGATTTKAATTEKPADDGTKKKRGMSPEHMAKIREARMAKRAEAGATTTKAAKMEKPADDGTKKKRGMSAEHMAKIREARMAKLAAAGATTTKAATTEKPANDGAPKKRGMSAEHMAKIREARMAKLAAAKK